mmetsp:Transcript_52186/g.155732  ORF Transcript_52186/g.155732 Transcript_52186/m.155732 type:complete len:325 (-) Transcript_52186:351-1325(-)
MGGGGGGHHAGPGLLAEARGRGGGRRLGPPGDGPAGRLPHGGQQWRRRAQVRPGERPQLLSPGCQGRRLREGQDRADVQPVAGTLLQGRLPERAQRRRHVLDALLRVPARVHIHIACRHAPRAPDAIQRAHPRRQPLRAGLRHDDHDGEFPALRPGPDVAEPPHVGALQASPARDQFCHGAARSDRGAEAEQDHPEQRKDRRPRCHTRQLLRHRVRSLPGRGLREAGLLHSLWRREADPVDRLEPPTARCVAGLWAGAEQWRSLRSRHRRGARPVPVPAGQARVRISHVLELRRRGVPVLLQEGQGVAVGQGGRMERSGQGGTG